MSNFRERTISSMRWSLFAKIGQQILLLIVNVVLARILVPSDFGLIAQIVVVTGFANLFAELGFGAALIQRVDINRRQVSSVFWINVFSGFFLTIIFIIFAPLIANFYDEPILSPLTKYISTTFLIGSFSIIQVTLLTKNLEFRRIAVIEISAALLSGIAAILMAIYGYGVWSLVVQSVTFSLLLTILSWLLSDWKPTLEFNFGEVKELLGFSTNLLGTQSLNYWVRNIDNLLVGKVLGPDSLGIYSRAYSIMLFPLNNISNVIARVMFPSFSMIQEDKYRVKSIFLRITRTIALFTFPLMLGLMVSVSPFVLTVFGSKWIEMIPVLRILCLVGLTQSIITLIGNIYLSQGRSDVQFKVGLILRLNLIIGIVLGLKWGVIGVATGYAIASFINIYPNVFFAGRLINLKFSDLVHSLSGVFFCSVAMALFVYGIGFVLPSDWSNFIILVSQITSGLFIYLLLINIFHIKAYEDARDIFIAEIKPWLRYKKMSQPNG